MWNDVKFSVINIINSSMRRVLLFMALSLLFRLLLWFPAWLTEEQWIWIQYTLDSPFQLLWPPNFWLCSSNTTAIYSVIASYSGSLVNRFFFLHYTVWAVQVYKYYTKLYSLPPVTFVFLFWEEEFDMYLMYL